MRPGFTERHAIMKRALLSAVAALTVLAPLSAGTASARDMDWRGDRHDDRGDRDGRRDHDGRGDRDGRWDRDGRGDRDGRWDRDGRGDRDGRWDRDGRGDRDGRWDDRRHNGYVYNNRWFFGPPPGAYFGRPGFRPDYREWRRGDYLPAYYRDRFVDVDYRYAHLRPPPYGYHYVRDDRGDIILAAIATGLIASIILNN
jgi:Ni/Co efflux regulator RcnB